MSISIGASSAPATAATASDIGVAVAKKALKQQTIEGEAAVRLIQNASKVTEQPAEPNRGRRLDVYA